MTRLPCALALAAALWSQVAWAGPLKVSVLDKEGKPVPDAVVVLVPAAAGSPRALPTKVTILQEKMRFLPAVTLVQVGAQALFVNNDPWEHHVRGTAAGAANFDADAKGGFELRLDGKAAGKPGPSAEAKFDKAGPVLLGCHLHASMRAHVFVADTPWASLTGDDGQAVFESVPEGALRYRVWHADQLIDLPQQQMTLTAAAASATVQLTVVPRRKRT